MNLNSLFSDAEVSENHIQNILDIDPAEQASQGVGRGPQILRGKFLALIEHRNAALQRRGRLLQQTPLSRPGDQATLALPKKILRKNHQSRDQRRNAVATGGGNFEQSHSGPASI